MVEKYVPDPLPENPSMEDLIAYIAREQQRISIALENMIPGVLEPLSAPPAKPFEYQIVAADGVNWSPGQGKGPYIYLDGKWIFMGRTEAEPIPPTDPEVEPPPEEVPPATTIAAADVVGAYNTSELFANQFGGTVQCIGTFTSVPSVAEAGIHHTNLGGVYGTQRFGKADGGYEFTLAPGDPSTSGSRRCEITTSIDLDHTGTYWLAYAMKIIDWGVLPSNDAAVIAFQVHSGGSTGLSPMVKMVARRGSSLEFEARHSSSTPPSQSTSSSVRSNPIPIVFGVFQTWVVQFKGSRGQLGGMVKAWQNGLPVFDFNGRVGYDQQDRPYTKWGYYNSGSGLNSPRRIVLRNPVIVRDPLGKYNEAALRAYVESL